jgi:hypothetical protein
MLLGLIIRTITTLIYWQIFFTFWSLFFKELRDLLAILMPSENFEIPSSYLLALSIALDIIAFKLKRLTKLIPKKLFKNQRIIK